MAHAGAVVEVNSETDFVAKNEEFKKFVESVAMQIAKMNPASVEELENQKSINEPEKTIKEILVNLVATIGENISIRRFERFESDGFVESYVHGDGRIGVLVDFEKGDDRTAFDVCMQIAAAKPEYVSKEDVPENVIASETDILKAQAMNEGKPEQIAKKWCKAE